MKALTDFLEVIKFQLLMKLPIGFEISFGNWSLRRLEDGIYESKVYLNEGEADDPNN
jgi:hypothetical protein